jgi:hypothetical protein
MSCLLLLRAVLRLLALDALGALYLTDILSIPTLAGIAALILASWWAEEIRAAVPGIGRFWDAVTVGFFVFTALDLLFLADSFIAGVVHLLVFLIIYKLYNTRRHRDLLDVFILTFLMLVAASTLTASFGLLPVFCGYMVLGILGLTLFHLKRETDLHLPERSRDLLGAPGLVTPTVLLNGAGMAILAMLLTLAIFLLVPRVGRTFFSLRGPLGTQTVGFSDRVDLGMYGTIQTDPTVVMRVSFPDDPNAVTRFPDLRWRGLAFDRFDGRTWSLAHPARTLARQMREAQYAVSPFALGEPFLAAEVFLEPIGTDLLFGPPRLRAIQGRLPRPSIDLAGAVTLPSPPNIRIRYLVVSQPERIREDVLQRPVRPDEYPPDVRDAYLQLPPLSPRVRALAESLAAGAETPMKAVRRMEAYLTENLRYSLDLGRVGRSDPLEDFLFERKTGNCEYFAASLVVLLRVAGIPARVVNGFQRGEWNEVGQYLAVRQRDAHSWAEVYVPGAGWLTVDPSPRAVFEVGAFGPSGWFVQYFDALRWRWNRYVVDYSLGDQAVFAMRVRQASLEIRRTLEQAWSLWASEAAHSARQLWRSAGYAVVALAVLAAAASMLWRRTPLGALGTGWLLSVRLRRSPVVFYERMLRLLDRQGWPRAPAVTAREFLTGLSGRPRLHEAATELTAFYERVRFGGQPLTPAEAKRVALLLGRLETTHR